MNCREHRVPNCVHTACRRERERRQGATTDTASDLANPLSPLHQAAYGGAFYGSTDTSSSSCDTSSSSSSSSYDSGSSSSSYDSGSSSSSDCG